VNIQPQLDRMDAMWPHVVEHALTSEDADVREWARNEMEAIQAATIPKIMDLALNALYIDGEHHKQWYLEQIARLAGADLADETHEPGIAP
jgi:hypothetical protein